ncbi:MAG: AraC family transcriptional regulator [Chthoniobacterales bacterium]
MKNYRPLLLQELAIRLPGCFCRRLRLNRHLPDVDSLSNHSHPYSQIIVYVRGGGTVKIESSPQPVAPGSVVFLPPRTSHAFDETGGRRPLCLVLDLDWRGATKLAARHARLPASQVSVIRSMLSELIALGDPNDSTNRLAVSAAVLRILDVVFRGISALPTPNRRKSAMITRVDRELRKSEPDIAIRALAGKLGYQADYLNRSFKRETGLSLREYRDALRIEEAKRLLSTGKRVTDVAELVGFADLNYFSRWFKKWAGVSPGRFGQGER